jgi:archaeal type IV pilus assembly protein PilA
MKLSKNDAVSPVVGVMLMLIVTIIIAAVVSAFAGGSLGNPQKTPQANIKGTFSTSGGMQIIHAGGDSIPTQDLIFETTHDPTFGTGLDAITTQVINRSIIMDVNGKYLVNATSGLSEVDPTFKPGDTLYINITYSDPKWLQPQVVVCNNAIGSNGHGSIDLVACPGTKNNWYDVYWDGSKYVYDYPGTSKPFWNLAFVNPNSVGKTFTFTVLDKRTNGVISKSTVTITS